MNNAETQTKDASRENGKKPDWVVKTPRSTGRNSRLERVGVAWNREDGGICARLVGKQVIDGDLYLYPITGEAADEGGAQ